MMIDPRIQNGRPSSKSLLVEVVTIRTAISYLDIEFYYVSY